MKSSTASHFIWHPTFPLHFPKQAHKTWSYCKELQHTRHGLLAKQLPCCLKADAWIREDCIWGEAWHIKTRCNWTRVGEPTQETLIFQRHRSLWSLGSHIKSRCLSRHADYGREDERLSTTITHHLVTGVKAARSQDAAAQSWLLPWDKLQSAECLELQRESKWITKGQVSPQVLMWCRTVSALRWLTEMKAERCSFVYKHARDNQVTVGSNFISEFHTLVTDHALGLSPLQIHSLQAWERWGIIFSLLTSCPHAKNEGPDGSLPGGAESSLFFP